MQSRDAVVYALLDPAGFGPAGVRYIGMTLTPPTKRLARHISDAHAGGRRRVHAWIKSLTSPPAVTVLCYCSESTAPQLERAFIALFREAGSRLTNLTDGGEGVWGYTPTSETIERIRAAKIGRSPIRTLEQKARHSEGLRRAWREHRQRRSRPQSPESNLKRSLAMKAAYAAHPRAPMSAEQRQKIAASLRGRSQSDESNAKRSASLRAAFAKGHHLKGRRQSPEHIAKRMAWRKAS